MPIYKSKQEEKLIKSLSGSHLISREQLMYIKWLYNESVPYHNFLHALKVAEGVLKLPKDKYNIIEIQSLFIAALFHDAWHTGTAEDLDEFRSLDMAFQWIIDFEKKYNYAWIDYSIVRKSIIGTVFKNRASNKDPYADLNYFKFLMWIEKNVYRNETIREIYPEYLTNIKKYIHINPSNIQDIYEYWRDNDITYDQFERYYKKLEI